MDLLLPPGKRAVAVRTSADTVAGGLIWPDMRVDILHTVKRKARRRGWNPIVVGVSAASVLVQIGLVWMAVHFSKSRRGDPRLIGTWQSDADATIMEIRKARPVTEKQEEAIRKLFGKMKITYTDATVTIELNGVVDTQPYQVVSKDGESVIRESLNFTRP